MTRQDAIKILIEYKDDSIVRTVREWEEYDTKMCQAIDMVIDALQDRPTGKWIITKEGEYDGRSVYKTVCSECGHETFYKADRAHFCPNCGAPMRTASKKNETSEEETR